jgi:hypothetical protein
MNMPTTALSVLDTQSIVLSFIVTEADWLGSFSHLEVWRSMEGESGPYERMTESIYAPAQLPVGAEDPDDATGGYANIVGKELEFLLNESLSLSYTFTGSNPLTRQQCATQLTAAFPAYLSAHVDEFGSFVVRTTQVGALASLRVLSTDAAALLELPTQDPDNLAYGLDARIPLLPGVKQYSFRDPFGKTSYAYKTRLYNALSGEFSAFSMPVSGAVRTAVSPDNVVIGFLRLMGLDGRSIKDREVLLYNSYTASRQGDFTIVNEGQRKVTDSNGYVAFSLMRGTTVDVLVPGTALSQRVTVPSDAAVTEFNLLDPAYGNNDAFGVQRVDFEYAERRSL